MTEHFDAIRTIVTGNEIIMADFTAAASQEELFARVIALGRERGLDVTTAELEEIVRSNRRSWLERWLF